MTTPTIGPLSVRPTQAEINQALLSVDHLKVGLGERTARGGAIVMTAQVIRIFVQLGTTFVLARLLSPDDFGVIAVGYTVLAFIVLFTELGLSTVTVQTKNLTQDTASALLYLNIGLTLVAVGVAAALGPVLLAVFKDERIPLVAVALVATSPINALGSQHYALMMRNMMWARVQVISFAALLAGAVAAVLSAWLLDIGYWALVVQALVSAIVGMAGAWAGCAWRPGLVRNWQGVGTALRMSINLSGTMALNFFHRQLDNMLIGWRWGSEELGYYSRSYALLMLPYNLVTGPLAQAIIPALSRLQDEPDKWRRAYLDALIAVTLLGGAMAAILFGAAQPIIDIILGPGWEKSERIFSLLVLALLVATPMSTVVWLYVSLGQTARMLVWGVMATSAYATAFFLGIAWGAEGVALAYSIAQFLAFLPCMWMASRHAPVTLGDILKASAPLMVLTIMVGAGLRAATGHFGLLADVAISFAALGIYCGLAGLIVWRWPPHARMKDRAIATLNKIAGRLGVKLGWLTGLR